MASKPKVLEKARRNPRGLRFGEFETLLRQCGWVFDHQTGSHRIWYSPRWSRISIQPMKDVKAKGYQVRQFLTQHDREAEHEEEDV